MSPRRILAAALATVVIVLQARAASASDSWLEVKSGHFTVISNAGEKKARNVAWQFEQIRSAIEKGWPWARVQLSLPVTVIAVKDEASMKALAPYYWEEHRDVHPSSVFATAGDRHYIALRADVEAEDKEGSNPYRDSFWSYASLSIESSFNRGLPLWFVTGLSAVLSNSIVRQSEIQFGRPILSFVRRMQQDSRLRLRELFAVNRQSPYYTQQLTRSRYSAECWTLVQYMLFGEGEGRRDHVDALTKLLLAGKPSEEAVTQVYGAVDSLEEAYFTYAKQGLFKYIKLSVDSDVSTQKYPSRPLSVAESASERAGFHVTLARLTEAHGLLEEARKANADLVRIHEVEGQLFDRESKSIEARHAYQKAADLDSNNFYVYQRLAVMTSRPNADTATLATMQRLLAKAIEFNDSFAPAFSFLANVMLLSNQAEGALGTAERAVALEPAQFSHRLLVARVLSRLSRTDEARLAAQSALEYARTDQERQAAQTALSALNRPAAPQRPAGGIEGGVVGGVAGGVVGGLSNASPPPPPPPPPAAPVRVGGAIKQPARLKDVRPTYPAIAQSARVQGVVVIEATIGPTGAVVDAKVLRSIPLLDQAALDAVRQWVYEPTKLNGVPVPVIMTVTTNFTLANSTTLRVTDAKGTVVIVKEAAADYVGQSASGSATSAVGDGIRVYQGAGQTIVRWSLIDTIIFTALDTASVPPRLTGEILLRSGQRMATDFVVPATGGGLKGKTDLGDYVIAFGNITKISSVSDQK